MAGKRADFERDAGEDELLAAGRLDRASDACVSKALTEERS